MGYKYTNMALGKPVHIKARFGQRPIREMMLQCPDCERWFLSDDIIQETCVYEYEIIGAGCKCPICGSIFKIGNNSAIEENGELYDFYQKHYMKKKVTWNNE